MTEQKIMEQAAMTAEYFMDSAISYAKKKAGLFSKEDQIKLVEIYVNACIADQNTMINNPKR